jgi:hypothetical protein
MWWWIATAWAKAPMNGVLVGLSAGPALVPIEPTPTEQPEWLRTAPDFGFELWGTNGKRKGGVRAGILFQLGFTPGAESTTTSLHLGGGPVVGGIWGARKGSYGTASVGFGAGGYTVGARDLDARYGSVGVWLRGEYAAGVRLGKNAVLEVGPTLTLLPPIRIGDEEPPWKGDYWGQVGAELTLLAFGKSGGGGGSTSPSPAPAPRPKPRPKPEPDSPKDRPPARDEPAPVPKPRPAPDSPGKDRPKPKRPPSPKDG